MKSVLKKDECLNSENKPGRHLAKMSIGKKMKNIKRKIKFVKRISYKKTPHNTTSYLIQNYKRSLSQFEPEDEYPIGTNVEQENMGAFFDTHPLQDDAFLDFL